jgi:serine protease Do
MSFFSRIGFMIAALAVSLSWASPFSFGQNQIYSIQQNAGNSYFGIQMEDVSSEDVSKYKLNGEKGVIVRSVQKGSPAAEAGIREEDVIVEYGGMQVFSSSQFSRLVQETPVGRKIEIALIREGKKIAVTAKISSRTGSINPRRGDGRSEIIPRDFFRQFPFGFPDNRDNDQFNEPEGKPRLGVTLQPLTDQLAAYMGASGKKGVLVASVIEGSPSAGRLKAGDIILSANGKSMEDPEDLTDFISKAKGTVAFTLIREKKEISVAVTLTEQGNEDGKGIKL